MDIEQQVLDALHQDTHVFFDDGLLKKIYVVLYLNEDPLSLEDIAKKSGLSLASVSNKSKILEHVGLVNRSKKQGSRKVFLQARTDFVSIMNSKLEHKKRCLESSKSAIDIVISNLKKKKLSSIDAKKSLRLQSFSRQMTMMISFHKKILSLIKK